MLSKYINYEGLILEESLLSSDSVNGSSGEESIVQLGGINLRNINLGGGWDNVGLVDSSERNSVDLEWSSDQEKSGWQLLQANDSFSFEFSGQQDQNGSWDDG